MNPFDFFEKIYCINLDERTDRWQACVAEFIKLGILGRVERVSAIKSEIGWHGCRRSHIQVWKDAISKNLKNFLVMEDDIEFEPNTIAVLTESIKELPEDWELFYLGMTTGELTELTGKHLVRVGYAYATHCYAVSERLYPILPKAYIEFNLKMPEREAIDVWIGEKLCKERKHAYSTNPLVCMQRAGYSDIEGRPAIYRQMMVNRFNQQIKPLEESARLHHSLIEPKQMGL